MERISLYQLFVLTVFFQIGTTIIFGFGASAGKDAWIVTMISTVLGLMAMGIYLILMHLNPGLTLVEWFPAQLGKRVGTPIAWLYPLLFLYEVGRILNDVKYLVTTMILKGTPPGVVIVLFILVAAYSQLCGIEVLGRTGEFFFPFFVFMFILLIIFIIGSDMLKGENLQPVFENGWSPIWQAAFPLGASQGFAQTLELAMIWTLVNSTHKHIVKTTIWATIFSGIVLLMAQLMLITGLNEFTYKADIYPMYTLISRINIGGFIKNIDVIAVIYFVLLAFFKISLHMFFAIRGIQLLTHTKNSRKLIIPITFLAIYLGYSVSANTQEHLTVAVKVLPYNLWLPLLWAFPILLLFITFIKKAAMKGKIF